MCKLKVSVASEVHPKRRFLVAEEGQVGVGVRTECRDGSAVPDAKQNNYRADMQW